MIYNTPDTIYFKAAKKLQQIGAKLMSEVCRMELQQLTTIISYKMYFYGNANNGTLWCFYHVGMSVACSLLR